MGLGTFGDPEEDRLDVRTVSADATTAGEDLLLLDAPASGSLTITLSTTDAEQGNAVIIKDATGALGGDAYAVVETETDENVDGVPSVLVAQGRAALALASDGTNWFDTNGPVSDAGFSVRTTEGWAGHEDPPTMTQQNTTEGWAGYESPPAMTQQNTTEGWAS